MHRAQGLNKGELRRFDVATLQELLGENGECARVGRLPEVINYSDRIDPGIT